MRDNKMGTIEDRNFSVFARIVVDTLGNGGTSTMRNGSPFDRKYGFVVGGYAETMVVGADDFSLIDVAKYAANIDSDDKILGTWLDDGKVHIDACKHIVDREEAIRSGILNGEKAIYDLANSCPVWL